MFGESPTLRRHTSSGTEQSPASEMKLTERHLFEQIMTFCRLADQERVTLLQQGSSDPAQNEAFARTYARPIQAMMHFLSDHVATLNLPEETPTETVRFLTQYAALRHNENYISKATEAHIRLELGRLADLITSDSHL